jgi:arylsulfatase A-like enzyme
VLKTSADGKIEDTGPLTKKRMETIDDETTAAAMDFMERQVQAKKPFFTWMNTTRMHLFTHVRPEYAGKSGMPGNEYADGMWEHDQDVGKLLKKLDDLGIADNTIVVYATDNGPNHVHLAGRGGDAVPQREGHQLGGRLPRAGPGALAGPDQAGKVSNEMFSGLDWFPTLLAAAGDTGPSRTSCSRARKSAPRTPRCISTATTSCPT